MVMKRSLAALVLALSGLATAASALESPALDELGSALAGMRAQTQRQKQLVQRPNFMGESGRFSLEALTSAAPDVSAYSVRGVDISHYQGAIAWDQVQADGLSFVYIKATEGGDGVDGEFAANWKGAAGAGLARGAYHFYNFCRNGSDQADNFIRTVPADAGILPATIDLEQSGDCSTMPAKDAFRADLAAFVAKVSAAYGSTPILYVNYAIYDRYFSGENDSYKLWIADVSDAAPQMPDNASWALWQYGWHGRLAGIPGEVDLDVFNGTPEMLASLSGGSSGVMLASAR